MTLSVVAGGAVRIGAVAGEILPLCGAWLWNSEDVLWRMGSGVGSSNDDLAIRIHLN